MSAGVVGCGEEDANADTEPTYSPVETPDDSSQPPSTPGDNGEYTPPPYTPPAQPSDPGPSDPGPSDPGPVDGPVDAPGEFEEPPPEPQPIEPSPESEPPPTGGGAWTLNADSAPECPDEPPPIPLLGGVCLGFYWSCGWTNDAGQVYSCVCDLVHYLCI